MLVVLSAAARFHSKPVTDLALRSSPKLLSKAKTLVQELSVLEAKDIKKQLHVNDALAKQYAAYLKDFEAKEPVPCCGVFDTPLWNSSALSSFDEDDAEWANSYVRIFSGLYGLLRPYDQIQRLSLPVSLSTKLKTTKGSVLRQYWAESIEKEIEGALQKLPMPVIVDMSNEEDRLLLDADRLPPETRVMKVEFKHLKKEGALEAQGEFLRWMLQNRCMTPEELVDFRGLEQEDEEEEVNSYRLHKNQPSPNHLVFEENKRDGGDGGWAKKLAEYGGSQRKFVKEFASGKEKWKRSELNKAVKKETKKRSSGSSFY
ncbi:unnamed protein product [Effrenium voratum]|uniref:Uncharacterized protein n=1 Tax=Effrenium voratum TaxID=2562239 RepID=A0AA36N407_9DINO|nr:unnamed protein product [Effrenium voratum]CAJ1393577.1 unnamed protein product [Effrenium voratum]CAJ1444288.1 unnamed protein product [Effrenium voratum]